MVADGRHSQVDGFTSLGVLLGVLGVRLGFPLADPLIGFVIGTTILVVAWNSGRELWYRLMDATDPETTRLVEQTVVAVPGVLAVSEIRIRWLGHWQHCELHITVDAQLPTLESHQIAESPGMPSSMPCPPCRKPPCMSTRSITRPARLMPSPLIIWYQVKKKFKHKGHKVHATKILNLLVRSVLCV